MLDHILIETYSELHHRAFEVENSGSRLEVFNWTGTITGLEKRIRWEYRKRLNRGTLSIKRADQPCVQLTGATDTTPSGAEIPAPATDA